MKPTSEVRARVLQAGGVELVERLDHLDGQRERRAPEESSLRPPDAASVCDFDVAIVGGGLWSLLAPVLAMRGVSVAVFDRARVGAAHREWNASGPELRALVKAGLVTDAELEALIVARYDHGICAFDGGGRYPVRGVLDHAVDAGALLAHGRLRGESAGVRYFDRHACVADAGGADKVRLRFRDSEGAPRELTTRLMVDARGASSPNATSDLVCPTVGGVLRGLQEGDGPGEMPSRVGEILATVDGVTEGRQHVWEAFPGCPGETTVYLFYYAQAGEQVSLWNLYARFFETLPRYKRGEATLVRPTFGLIPGWSRLTPAPKPPAPHVVLVGDAAGRHSPLTYCGFGGALRSLVPAADAIVSRLEGEPPAASIVHDAPIHALTGILAHVMASRAFHGAELNTLLDAAFGSLAAMGNDPYARLLRDEMAPGEFIAFLRATARRHPKVWGKLFRGIGLSKVGLWSIGLGKTLMAHG